MAVVHAGGRGREKENAFNKSPNRNGDGGHAAGEDSANEGDQQLDNASGGKAQIEVVDAQTAKQDSQKAGRQTALLIVSSRRHGVLGLIVGLLGCCVYCGG